MSAKCIYCRAELAAWEVNDWCHALHACRERMRDREKRIVRVFWFLRWVADGVPKNNKGFADYESLAKAREMRDLYKEDYACPVTMCRVTVRRKGKG